MHRIWQILILITLTLSIYYTVSGSWNLNSDLKSILPNTVSEPLFEEAEKRYQEQLTRSLLLVLSHKKSEQLDLMVSSLQAEQKKWVWVSTPAPSIEKKFSPEVVGKFYYPRKNLFIPLEQIEEIEVGATNSWLQQASSKMYSPFGGYEASSLLTDPFGFIPKFLNQLGPSFKFIWKAGVLQKTHEGLERALISMSIRPEADNMRGYERVISDIDKWQQRTEADVSGSSILRLSYLFYMKAGQQQAVREISVFGSLSLILIISLLLFSFKSMSVIWVGFAQVAFSLIAALTWTRVVFSEVHLLTLVMGTGLIGLSIDYLIHYVAHDGPNKGMGLIVKPLVSAFITSCLGYLFFLTSGSRGLQELAVFAFSGLLVALLTVLWGLGPKIKIKELKLPIWFHTINSVLKTRTVLFTDWRNPIMGLLIALIALVIVQVQFSNDIRNWQSRPKDLADQESQIKKIIGENISGQHILFRAKSMEKLLQSEEQVMATFSKKERHQISALSKWLPSQKRQRRSLAASDKIQPLTKQLWTQLGLPLKNQVFSVANTDPVSWSEWESKFLNSPVMKQNLGETQGYHFSVMSAVNANLAQKKYGENILVVDQVAQVSKFFTKMSHYIAMGVFAAFIMGFLIFLIGRFPVMNYLSLTIPPIAAAILSLGVASFFYETHFFSILAAILVIAIGIDYTFFYYFMEDEKKDFTDYSVFLSYISTLLAFGVLSLSQTNAVSAFGLVVVIGMSLAYLLAPMAKRVKP